MDLGPFLEHYAHLQSAASTAMLKPIFDRNRVPHDDGSTDRTVAMQGPGPIER